MKKDPETNEKVPVRYRLATPRSLCEKFNTESSLNCSSVYFQNNCPFDVIKPNPNDWGTCCCQTCLNPELKLDAISKVVEDSSLKWDEAKDYQDIDNSEN